MTQHLFPSIQEFDTVHIGQGSDSRRYPVPKGKDNWCQRYETFLFVTEHKARVSAPGKPVQPGLTFAGRAIMAYPRREHLKDAPLGQAPALHSNVRLGRKALPGGKTLQLIFPEPNEEFLQLDFRMRLLKEQFPDEHEAIDRFFHLIDQSTSSIR